MNSFVSLTKRVVSPVTGYRLYTHISVCWAEINALLWAGLSAS